jgi:DNA-binding HxlR family transcriptional regulator
MTAQQIVAALRDGLPFADLPGVGVAAVLDDPRDKGPLDVKIVLSHGDTRIEVFAEIKNACTPKQVKEIAPWLARMKAARPEAAFALICPALSPESQTICAEHQIDFIDLAGNVSIGVPGKFVLQRVGLKPKATLQASSYRDPFAGRASRVVRVLLQRPGEWTLTHIAKELEEESRRSQLGAWNFAISLGSISKTLRSLEEQLLVRRRGSPVVLAEPERLLQRWAEKYRERSRGYLRGAVTLPNPFGNDVQYVARVLRREAAGARFAFTGAAAAAAMAPVADLDVIELYADHPAEAARFFTILPEHPSDFPVVLRCLRPYDGGVFMYGQVVGDVPVVSDIQTYLDLLARGGRDAKQAEYFFQKVVRAHWRLP